MGLTENQKRLIMAVTKNDQVEAKKCALACIGEDKTEKNRSFCNKYNSILRLPGWNTIEIPRDLKDLICVEDVSTSFRENRYYLSKREEETFNEIMRMKKVNEKLVELGISYANSTLIHGVTGTGKTTFGRFVAYKMGLPFCYLKFSHLVDSLMGHTSKNISKAFSYAIENPCVMMLDELDCISIRRSDVTGSSGGGGEMARITITVMQELDKLPNDTIVIAATNRYDRIDEAIRRRFFNEKEVQLFSLEEKREMVVKYLGDIEMEFSSGELDGLINQNISQAETISELIRMIALKIEKENCDD